MKGIFEFEVQGKKRGFKFGTYAFAVACEKDNCTMDQMEERIGLGGKKRTIKLMSLLNLFYGTAVHYNEEHKLEIDFTVVDVSNWLDELGYEKVQNYLAEGLYQHVPKNSKSLAETREEVTQ